MTALGSVAANLRHTALRVVKAHEDNPSKKVDRSSDAPEPAVLKGITKNSSPSIPGQTSGSTNIKDQSFDELDARADSLRSGMNKANTSVAAIDAMSRELTAINNELEIRSLDVLEEHLVGTESEENNFISADELYDYANDGYAPKEVEQAAQFFMDNKFRRDQLSGADQISRRSGNITIGEIHARRLEVNSDVENANVPQNTGTGEYELPTNRDFSTTRLESPQRDQGLFDQQQDAIEESMRTGEEVEFETSDGVIHTILVETNSYRNSANYTVHVDDRTFKVESEIGLEETIEGVASVVEFGSTMDIKEELNPFPDTLKFDKDRRTKQDKDGTKFYVNDLATYSKDHQLTYYKGDENINNAELYYHEIGHGIGRQLDDNTNGTNDSSPAGWPKIDAHEEYYGNLVTEYADKNNKESFAEAFAAYVNAKNHGEDALKDFRAAYPVQAAYIDEEVFGILRPNAPDLDEFPPM